MRRPTIHAVGDTAGVSIATVDRVLAARGNVETTWRPDPFGWLGTLAL